MNRSCHFVSPSCARAVLFMLVLVVARSVSAQDTSSANGEPSGRWVPIGSPPVDQAGAGRRGYVLPAEDSEVAATGSGRFSLHTVAANNFYREQNGEFLVSQRFETHTFAFDYRRGFAVRGLHRFEIGGQIQFHERDSGVLNGFINGAESFWASVTGYEQSRNELRTQRPTPLALGTVITRHGAPIYRQEGGRFGVGDGSAVVKVALRDSDLASGEPRMSARIGINVAGRSLFSEGNYLGAGFSLDQKLSESVAFHSDVRTTRALDHISVLNLPLRRWTFGFSAGPEFRLPKRSSFNLQIEGSSTPYQPTGTRAFDKGYGALTFGAGHRFGPVAAQLYVRENMNLPFAVRWNTDPDLSVGLKLTIR